MHTYFERYSLNFSIQLFRPLSLLPAPCVWPSSVKSWCLSTSSASDIIDQPPPSWRTGCCLRAGWVHGTYCCEVVSFVLEVDCSVTASHVCWQVWTGTTRLSQAVSPCSPFLEQWCHVVGGKLWHDSKWSKQLFLEEWNILKLNSIKPCLNTFVFLNPEFV